MKRLMVILGAMVLILVVIVWATQKYSNTHTFDFNDIDSTAASLDIHTDSLTSGSTTGAPIFYWTPSTLSGDVWGTMSMYILSRDTGVGRVALVSTSNVVDTTKDTVIATLYAGDYNLISGNSTGYNRWGEKALCSLTFTAISKVAGATTPQTFRADRTLTAGKSLYWRIRGAYEYTGTSNNQNIQAIKYKIFLQEYCGD